MPNDCARTQLSEQNNLDKAPRIRRWVDSSACCRTPKMTNNHKPDAYLAQFGSGLCYSLGLFLAHEGNFKYVLAEVEMLASDGALQFTDEERRNPAKALAVIERLAAIRWFSHSVNPLRNLVMPPTLPEALRRRLQAFRDKCVRWSLSERSAQPGVKQVAWALNEARELLRQIDELHNVRTIKADATMSERREGDNSI